MIEGTIVIEFNGGEDGSDYIAFLDWDGESNLDDEGNATTSFAPGDQPVLIANFSSNVVIEDIVATAGDVTRLNTTSRTKESTNLFASRNAEDKDKNIGPDTFKLPVVPSSVNTTYDGRQGAVTTENLGFGVTELTGDITKTPFLAKISSTYSGTLYRLRPPEIVLEEDESYTIHVVFYLTLSGAS